MPRRKSDKLKIAGHVLERGTTNDLLLDYSESYTGVTVSVPVRVIRAEKPGPTVFLSALVHGDELNGLGIIHELMFEQQLPLLRGTVIAIPVVNVYGLETYSRYLPDRRDLNRSFPGTARGSLTSRLAHLIYNEVIRHCDIGIDLHTAAVRRTNYPNIRADIDNAQVREIAGAFGCELVVHTKGEKGSLRRTAVSKGIPTIVLEAGEVWKIEPGVVELGVRGITNVFKHLKMLPGKIGRPAYQCFIRESKWIRSESGGVLKFHVKPGQVVRQGQIMATSLSILGTVKDQIVAPADGIIQGMATMPIAKPGEPVFHLAIPEEPIDMIERRIRKRDKQALHSRIQTELATNFSVKSSRMSRHAKANSEVPVLEGNPS